MSYDIGDVVPCILISAEHVPEEVYALSTYCLPDWLFKSQFFVTYAVLNLLNCRTFERHLARELLVKNAAKAPNIALEVARLLKNNLRRLVANCPSFLYEALIVFEVTRQTKVCNFDFWSLVCTAQEDVLVLYVTVHDIFLVDVF